MRPVKRKRLAPAAPSRAKEPLTRVQRVQAFFLRFFLVVLSQVVLRPWRTERPLDGFSTVNVTRAARESWKVTTVPTGVAAAVALVPESAARKDGEEKPNSSMTSSAPPPAPPTVSGAP